MAKVPAQEVVDRYRAQFASLGRKFARGGLTRKEALDAAGYIVGWDVQGMGLLEALATVAPNDPLATLAEMLPPADEFDEENQVFRIDTEAVLGIVLGWAQSRSFLDTEVLAQLREGFGARLRSLSRERLIATVSALGSGVGALPLDLGTAEWIVAEVGDEIGDFALEYSCCSLALAAAEKGDEALAMQYLRRVPDPLWIGRSLIEHNYDGPHAGLAERLYRWAVDHLPARPPVAEEVAYAMLIGDDDWARELLDEGVADSGERAPELDWLLAVEAQILGRRETAERLALESLERTGFDVAKGGAVNRREPYPDAELWVLALDKEGEERLRYLWYAMAMTYPDGLPDVRVRIDAVHALIAHGDLRFAAYLLHTAEERRDRPATRGPHDHFRHRILRPGGKFTTMLDRRLVADVDLVEARAALSRAFAEAGLDEPDSAELSEMGEGLMNIERCWPYDGPSAPARY